MMKKHRKAAAVTATAAVTAMLLLSACGKDTVENSIENLSNISAANLQNLIDGTEQSVEKALEKTASAEQEDKSESGKILIAYFSRWGNTDYPDDVDATTSASIVAEVGERYGTTEYAAKIIGETVGGDLHRIETVTPYATDFDELRDVNHSEMQQGFLPELKESDLDISQYDTVFIGYPIWWGEAPRIVSTFMESYDFSGKTIIPFCTSGGSGMGSSASNLEALTSGADWLDGRRLNSGDSQDTVMDWVNGLGLDIE